MNELMILLVWLVQQI